jgi:hypothetical protein
LDILKSRLPNASLTELAITIQKALPGKYRNENPDSFRKRLGEARRKFERLMQEDPLSASRWLLVGARALDADNQEPHAFDARSRLGNKFADFY